MNDELAYENSDFMKQVKKEMEKLTKEYSIEDKMKEIYNSIEKLSRYLEEKSKIQKQCISKAFKEMNIKVKEEMKNKADRLQEMFNVKLNLETNQKLKVEVNTFRDHSLRLNQLCIELNDKITELTRKLDLYSKNCEETNKLYQRSEEERKKLLKEFENEITKNKILEDKLIQVNEEFKKQIEDIELKQMNAIQDESKKEYYYNIIEKLKIDLKTEKNKNNKYKCECNKMIQEKSQLEKVFIDCVEETRKNILSRRMKEKFRNKKNFKMILNKSNSLNIFPTIKKNICDEFININYDTFNSNDKEQILIKFIFNEEVIKVLRKVFLINPQKEQKIINIKNQLIEHISDNSIHLSSTNYKLDNEQDNNLFLSQTKFKLPNTLFQKPLLFRNHSQHTFFNYN